MVHQLDGPWFFENLKAFAFGVLFWKPNDFKKASCFDVRNAINGYLKELDFKAELQSLQIRKLAYANAASSAKDFDLFDSIMNPKEDNQPPISPIDSTNKLEALSNHFKPTI